jgi:hypothetical protein
MSRGHEDMAALLRWYPQTWRDRYGDELVALMEDELGERPPTLKFKMSMAWAGLRERAHGTGLIGEQHSPIERTRAGTLLVLCSWTAFVVAGISFSKTSEHFAQAVPVASRSLAQDAFNMVVTFGLLGSALVVLGGLAALPAFVRFIRGGGWPTLRGHLLRACLLTAVTGVALIPLGAWAHHLNQHQRNGGDGVYSTAIVAWAVLVAATLAQWTVAAVAAGRRIDVARRLLRLEAGLAVAVTGAMLAITTAAALWWAAIALHAPWFLQGTATGSHRSPFDPQLVFTLALMLAAVLAAGYGVARITRSAGAPRTK